MRPQRCRRMFSSGQRTQDSAYVPAWLEESTLKESRNWVLCSLECAMFRGLWMEDGCKSYWPLYPLLQSKLQKHGRHGCLPSSLLFYFFLLFLSYIRFFIPLYQGSAIVFSAPEPVLLHAVHAVETCANDVNWKHKRFKTNTVCSVFQSAPWLAIAKQAKVNDQMWLMQTGVWEKSGEKKCSTWLPLPDVLGLNNAVKLKMHLNWRGEIELV